MMLAYVLALAAAVVARPLTSSDSACPGFTPVSDVFSIGLSQQYIMDVTPDPSAWDGNTTKIFYRQPCETDRNTTHQLAFVNLDDCSPVTARYDRIPDMDRSDVSSYAGMLGPTINATVHNDGMAQFACYPTPPYGQLSWYTYEVHFAGLHRSEQLAGLGFYDRIIN